MADTPTPCCDGDGSRSASRVTFGALWELCDVDRAQAESLVETYADSVRSPPIVSDLPFYRRRLRECETRAAQLLTLQKLIERCDRSAVIKAELKRMVAAERAASDAAVASDIDHVEE